MYSEKNEDIVLTVRRVIVSKIFSQRFPKKYPFIFRIFWWAF